MLCDNTMRILACLHDLNLLVELMDSIRSYPNVYLCALSSLPSDVKDLNIMNVDICLLDYKEDCHQVFSFVYSLNHLHGYEIPVLILSKKEEDAHIKVLRLTSKMTSYICAPYTCEEILNHLLVKGRMSQQRTVIVGYSSKVSQIIQELGIPLHYNGFRFIKSAAILIYQCDGQILSMVQLYKKIARIHKTTSSRVEKAIRDAIEYAYRTKERLNIEGRKPTNSQLVYYVYEQALNESVKAKEEQERRG